MSRHKQTPTNSTPSDTTIIQVVVDGQVAILGHTVEADTIGSFSGSAIKVGLCPFYTELCTNMFTFFTTRPSSFD